MLLTFHSVILPQRTIEMHTNLWNFKNITIHDAFNCCFIVHFTKKPCEKCKNIDRIRKMTANTKSPLWQITFYDIYTAVLYNMKHCECLFFFLLVLAEALFCCDSFFFFIFHDSVSDYGCVRVSNISAVDVCYSVRIFDIQSWTVSVLHNHIHSSNMHYTYDERHDFVLCFTDECGSCRCMCVLRRSVNGSSMHVALVCVCFLINLDVRYKCKCVTLRPCACLCVVLVDFFHVFTVGRYAECRGAIVQKLKIHSILASNENEIITVIINKRTGKQHTRASPSAKQNKSLA